MSLMATTALAHTWKKVAYEADGVKLEGVLVPRREALDRRMDGGGRPSAHASTGSFTV